MVQKLRVKKGYALNQREKVAAQSFLMEVAENPEGISAERAKFIHGMKTDSHKVLPPNKSE
ncbi:MAG: hypothetical protein ACOYI2_08800 [Bacillota bacterium]|jgi:hypothetical protein|nr:hypothetical protein [Clostridia bacterium]